MLRYAGPLWMALVVPLWTARAGPAAASLEVPPSRIVHLESQIAIHVIASFVRDVRLGLNVVLLLWSIYQTKISKSRLKLCVFAHRCWLQSDRTCKS